MSLRIRIQRAILKWSEEVEASNPDLVEALLRAIPEPAHSISIPSVDEIEEVLKKTNGKRAQAREVCKLLGRGRKVEPSRQISEITLECPYCERKFEQTV